MFGLMQRLTVEPLDMRAGTESALTRVVKVFGAAHPHTAYLFANRHANPQAGLTSCCRIVGTTRYWSR